MLASTWFHNLLKIDLKFTFSGRRLYKVYWFQALEDGWYDVTLVTEDHYGMYPGSPESDEEYARWVHDHGADPFFDEVLAQSYIFRVLRDEIFHGAEGRVRNPQARRFGGLQAYTLEMRPCV